MTDFALLGIKVDSKEVRAATKDLDTFRRGSRGASAGAKQFQTASHRLERQLHNTLSPLRQMRNLLIGVGIVEAAKGVIHIADSFQLLNARVRTVTDSIEEQQMAIEALRESANAVGVSLESATKLFIRTQRVREELGATTQEVLQFVDTIQRITLVSGASAQESSSAMIQLSQAIASGTLRGEELRSVMEQIPAVVKTIADEYDITIGEFRKLAEQGNITAETVFKAINNATLRVAEEAGKIPDTVGRALGALRNEFQAFTGEINQQFNLTGKLAESIRWLADNITTLVDALKIMTSVLAGRLVVAIIAATTATIKSTAAAKADAIAKRDQAAANLALAKSELALAKAQQAQSLAQIRRVSTFRTATESTLLGSRVLTNHEKVLGKVEKATRKYNKAVAAAVPLQTVGRFSKFLSIFGGIPGIVTAAALAFITFKSETDRVADSLEGLQDELDEVNNKLINQAVGQNLIRAHERIARLRVLYKQVVEDGKEFAKELERQNFALSIHDKERLEALNKRGATIQKQIENEREYIEEVKEGYKELQKGPKNLKGTLDNLIGSDKKVKDQTKNIERYIERLATTADQQTRLAAAYLQGEQAVAALNMELEIENALRQAGAQLTLDQAAAIIREVRERQAAVKVINDQKKAQEAAEKAAEDAKRKREQAAEEFAEPFERAAENVQRAWGDTFTEIYREGRLSFDSLADAIKDIMARLAGEITALLIFRPQIAMGGLGGILGGLGIGPAQAGGAGFTGAASGGLGGFLAGGGSTGLLATLGLSAGALLAGGALSGGFGNRAGTLGTLLGGGIGGYGGLLVGSSTALGPLGIPLGVALGSFLGGSFGSLFGGGNDKQKLGILTTGAAGGVESPFGNIQVTRQKNIDANAIVQGLADIDETLARLLSPEQTASVRTALEGQTQFFSAHQFDNEAWDIVRVRLGRIVDAVAGNQIASRLLDKIPRSEGNVDELVSMAEQIIGMVNLLTDNTDQLNEAELSVRNLNEQFDELAKAADQLGFSVEDVEQRRSDALAKLTTDFNASIRDQILAIENPMQLALEQLERLHLERLANAETLNADQNRLEYLYQLERLKIIEQFADKTTSTLEGAFDKANESIQDFLTSLGFSEAGGLPLAQRAANAGARFNELLSAARTDPTARMDLAQFLPEYLSIQRERLGSSTQFFEFQDFLRNTLSNLTGQNDTVLTDIGDAITKGDNAIIDTLRDEIGQLRATVADLNADIALLLNAPKAA